MLRSWFQKQKAISQKTGGLEEKRIATQKKIDIANRILDRRQEERRKHSVPIEEERRGHAPDFVPGVS